MPFRPLQFAGTTLAIALLAACGSTPLDSQAQSQAFATQGGDLPIYGPTPEPVPVPGAKPIKVGGFEALQGDGLYYFNGTRMTQLRVNGGQSDQRWPVIETTTDATTTTLNGHLDASHLVRDGERRPVGKPSFASPGDNDSAVLLFAGNQPMRVALKLKAFDVAGLPVRNFLRTPDNQPNAEVNRAGDARFPAGAVAYLAEVRFLDDVLMLPQRESFTGAKDTTQLVNNFSRNIPYCLSYEDRNGATPYALQFKTAPGAKKGKAVVYAAKPGTLFCARASEQELGQGEWEERTIGGTRTIVLSFAQQVDPLDTGVTHAEREAAKIAFIEPTKGAPGVRPGKLYQAGARVLDYQYRFNKTAADAVRVAVGLP
ncbi:MAG: hypothetical protein RR240_11360 [Burkholderiaceae bacterium]